MNIPLLFKQSNLITNFFTFYVPVLGWLTIILLSVFSVLYAY